MRVIAIDGACRRNGKPDCTSSGGVFVQVLNGWREYVTSEVLSTHEYASTNQRGELLALLLALDNACMAKDADTFIITDSEYIFNAMTKAWFVRWYNNNWKTAAGESVKNSDIWLEIFMAMRRCEEADVLLHFYHIKGHCIPFGRVTADNLLARDPSGKLLLDEVHKKFSTCKSTKQDVFAAAQELSERNNGFKLPDEIFESFVVANVVADAIATKTVEAADSSRKR